MEFGILVDVERAVFAEFGGLEYAKVAIARVDRQVDDQRRLWGYRCWRWSRGGVRLLLILLHLLVELLQFRLIRLLVDE